MTQVGSFGRPYPRSAARWQGVLTTIHIAAYRLSGGRLGTTLFGMPMLLLTTIGRRTGKLRTAPLLYLPIDDIFVLVASNGGARYSPTWWYNLQTYPQALVQIGPFRGRVDTRQATSEERLRFWPKLLQVYPTYDRYQALTDRLIPVVVVKPIDPEVYQGVPEHYRTM